MASVLGIGVDLISTNRLRAIYSRRRQFIDRFSKRILAKEELKYFQKHFQNDKENDMNQALQYLGVRWATKEATYKALSAYYPKLSWYDLVLFKQLNSSRPVLQWSQVSSTIPKEISNIEFHISISHEEDMIIAMVLAMMKPT
jgi:holo-[acyl-carrier protein] synthase